MVASLEHSPEHKKEDNLKSLFQVSIATKIWQRWCTKSMDFSSDKYWWKKSEVLANWIQYPIKENLVHYDQVSFITEIQLLGQHYEIYWHSVIIQISVLK